MKQSDADKRCICCGSADILYLSAANLRRCGFCGYMGQVKIEPFDYGAEYVAKGYAAAPVLEMSWLRLSILHPFVKKGRVLDFGYGDGEFVRQANRAGYEAYGFDTHNDNLNCPTVGDCSGKWDAVTMFDSIEHVADLKTAFDRLDSDVFVITTPHPGDNPPEGEILSWRHYKPNEHLHYFTPAALSWFFRSRGYRLMHFDNTEDMIRKNPGKDPNVVTYVFRRG